jgi:hypothetical protein
MKEIVIRQIKIGNRLEYEVIDADECITTITSQIDHAVVAVKVAFGIRDERELQRVIFDGVQPS